MGHFGPARRAVATNDARCKGAWVAAGAPIAAHDRIGDVATTFLRAARDAGRRCCLFATEDRFLRAGSHVWRSALIGEQPVWDPREWRTTLAGHASLREQLRRARAKGVRVRMATTDELGGPLAGEITSLVARWLSTRGMAPMAFLVRIELFTFLPRRAERNRRAARRRGDELGRDSRLRVAHARPGAAGGERQRRVANHSRRCAPAL